jgi:Uma2 family endonuclease
MVEQGWFLDKRVEFIEGEIKDMFPISNNHNLSVKFMEDALNAAFGLLFWVRVQMPIDFSPRGIPLPDLAVISGNVRSHRGAPNPSTALLVAEISESSLTYDRGYKASLYAISGIQDYWILNLVDRQLEIYRNIQPDPAAYYGVAYADVSILGPSDFATPPAAPQARIAVADLLP